MQALAKAQQDRTSEEFRAVMALGLNPADSPGKNLPDFLEEVDRMRKHYGENALPALNAMGVSWIGAGDRLQQLREQYAEQSRHLDAQINPQVMQGYQDVTANFMINSARISNEKAPTLTVWRLSVSHVFGILHPLPASGINVSSGP